MVVLVRSNILLLKSPELVTMVTIEEHLEQLSSLNFVTKLCQEHSGNIISSHEVDNVSDVNSTSVTL